MLLNVDVRFAERVAGLAGPLADCPAPSSPLVGSSLVRI
jgi:hypothetical protein